MRKPGKRNQHLIGLFLLGCGLFSYPMLAVFNVRAMILGVPVLYAYLFLAWAVMIALVALIMSRRD
jgi:hypothetical protein